MRVHHFLLLVLAALVASCTAAQSTADSTGRSLRAAVTFDEVDNSEERAPNLSPLKNAMSKTITSVATSMKIKMWEHSGKNVDELKKLLGLQNLDDAALKSSSQFKVYDELLTAQVSRWSKKDMTPEQVRVFLGIDKLSDFALVDNVNLKYYERFVQKQIPKWVKQDTSVGDVWKMLGLNKMTGETKFANSPNYQLHNKFINSKFENYAINGLTQAQVEAKMGLSKMAGLEQYVHKMMAARYTERFDKYRLDGWKNNGFTSYDVWATLKVGAIRPGERAGSPEYQTYRSYAQMLDDKIERSRERHLPATNVIGKKATPAEISARIKIWVDSNRSNNFVEYALGLNGLEGKKLTKNKNYKHYLTFLEDKEAQKKPREQVFG